MLYVLYHGMIMRLGFGRFTIIQLKLNDWNFLFATLHCNISSYLCAWNCIMDGTYWGMVYVHQYQWQIAHFVVKLTASGWRLKTFSIFTRTWVTIHLVLKIEINALSIFFIVLCTIHIKRELIKIEYFILLS